MEGGVCAGVLPFGCLYMIRSTPRPSSEAGSITSLPFPSRIAYTTYPPTYPIGVGARERKERTSENHRWYAMVFYAMYAHIHTYIHPSHPSKVHLRHSSCMYIIMLGAAIIIFSFLFSLNPQNVMPSVKWVGVAFTRTR